MKVSVSLIFVSKFGSVEIIFPLLSNHSNIIMLSPDGVNLHASSVVDQGTSELFLPGGTYPWFPALFWIPNAAAPSLKSVQAFFSEIYISITFVVSYKTAMWVAFNSLQKYIGTL